MLIVRNYDCPLCGAKAGAYCLGHTNARKTHRPRFYAFERMAYELMTKAGIPGFEASE